MTPVAAPVPAVPRGRPVRRMVLRPLGTVGLSVAAYYWLPLPGRSDPTTIVLLMAGLTSDYPRARAIEALAVAAPMFLLLFAAAYFMIARSSTTNFGTALTRTDALYFSVTVFSTAGFGDITPRSSDARLLVTGQMIGDMIFLGLGIRQLVTATQVGLQRRSRRATQP
jgi:voltage-gated potassium channel